jgi:hypothetical protein
MNYQNKVLPLFYVLQKKEKKKKEKKKNNFRVKNKLSIHIIKHFTEALKSFITKYLIFFVI